MEAAQKMAEKLKSGDGFDLNDFLAQLQQMKQMGGLSNLMDKLPSEMMAKAGQVDMDKAEREIKRKEGIICSMTLKERKHLPSSRPRAKSALPTARACRCRR